MFIAIFRQAWNSDMFAHFWYHMLCHSHDVGLEYTTFTKGWKWKWLRCQRLWWFYIVILGRSVFALESLIEEICMKLMCQYERSDVSPVCWLQVFLIQGNVWSRQMAVSLGFLGPWGIDGLAGCFQTILKVLVLKASSISNIFRDFHEAGYTWTRSIVPLWHQRGLHDLSHPKSFRLSNHSCHLQCLVELQAYDGMLEVAHAQQWGKTLQQTEDWSFYPLGSVKKTFTAEMQGNLLDVVKLMDPPDFSSYFSFVLKDVQCIQFSHFNVYIWRVKISCPARS